MPLKKVYTMHGISFITNPSIKSFILYWVTTNKKLEIKKIKEKLTPQETNQVYVNLAKASKELGKSIQEVAITLKEFRLAVATLHEKRTNHKRKPSKY